MKTLLRNIPSVIKKYPLPQTPTFIQKIPTAASFCVSTIVLGVSNANLRSDLQKKHKEHGGENEGEGNNSSTYLPNTTHKPVDMSKYRLPSSIRPKKYNLYFYPNLDTGNFSGKVVTNLSVLEPTDVITLHSKGLSIKTATIDGEQATTSLDEQYELLSLRKKSGKSIDGRSSVMTIEFEGGMKNKLVGLYRSTYKGAKGLRTIATSKFEPTYARQAFPCFDEPNMKATYTVHLWKPSDPDYIALSNYPQVGEEDYEGGKLVHFEETVSMSTYLTCFIVSDFNYTETFFDNNGTQIPFRVYATPDQLEKTKYAGTVGKKTIEYYIKYFDIPYPLPKLDMVAIPDFSSGAMEHWGLVTYRETALLYTPETHSAENKQRVLVVVAHELAHSWFGNLVTMDWWDNLWLNEGFASYIEYKGGDAAEPSFGLMEQFLVSELHPVLTLDAKLSSHPIIQEVGTPDQITEVFDTISYNKGASVLRMLEHAVGENNFKKGVTNYLNKHKYGNAVTKDLWSEIQDVVGSSINVTDFMDSFTIQMGYPILEVTVVGDTYTLTQKRFLTNPDDVGKQKPSPLGYKWTIPVTYVTDKGHSEEVIWFNRTKDNIVVKKPTDAKWLKFNAHQAGYYRVNYPENLWKELGSIMFELPISDRTHLLEEAFSIATSGQISYNIPLDLTKYLKNENNYAPWQVASTDLQHMLKLLKSTQYEQQYKNYVISILTPVYNNLSWIIDENDSHLTKLTRVVVLKLACTMGYEVALQDASSQLDKWFVNRTAPPDLREIIYKYGMKTANPEKWEKMFEIFKEESDANEKLKLLRGLTAVNDPSLLARMIEFSKDETYIRKQDYFHFVLMIARNPIGLPLIWDYVRENWGALVERFTLNDRYLGEIIPGIASSFSTKIKLSEMENFFKAYPEAGAGTVARKRALENVRNNIVWLSKYKDTVERWILANSS